MGCLASQSACRFNTCVNAQACVNAHAQAGRCHAWATLHGPPCSSIHEAWATHGPPCCRRQRACSCGGCQSVSTMARRRQRIAKRYSCMASPSKKAAAPPLAVTCEGGIGGSMECQCCRYSLSKDMTVKMPRTVKHTTMLPDQNNAYTSSQSTASITHHCGTTATNDPDGLDLVRLLLRWSNASPCHRPETSRCSRCNGCSRLKPPCFTAQCNHVAWVRSMATCAVPLALPETTFASH